MSNDWQLIQEFVRTGDDAPFADLVRRHLPLVRAAALRRLGGDAHAADDVCQAVFALLARRAADLTPGVPLPGWLVRATRYACRDAARARASRTRAERAAALARSEVQPPPTGAPCPGCDTEAAELRAGLEDALDRLPARDREAVVLRFLRGQRYAAVAAALGTTEQAARKRVGRAVGRLRQALARRGLLAAGVATSLSDPTPATAATGPGLPCGLHPLTKGALAMTVKAKLTSALAAALVLAATIAASIGVSAGARPPAPRPAPVPNPLPATTAPATAPHVRSEPDGPDLATPEAAVRSLLLAAATADAPKILRCLHADDAADESLNAAWAAVTAGSTRLLGTMAVHFGNAAWVDASGQPWPDLLPDLAADERLIVEPSPKGDEALVGNDRVGWARLIRDDKRQWKLAIAQTYPRDSRAGITAAIQGLAARMEHLVDEIESGRCATLRHARQARLTCTGGRILLARVAVASPTSRPDENTPPKPATQDTTGRKPQ